MKEDSKWFFINDFEEFVNSARSLVFKAFGETEAVSDDELSEILSQSSLDIEDQKELDRALSFSECSVIVKSRAKARYDKKTKTTQYAINNRILYQILEDFNSRMISNILQKLVSDNVLESAFDIEKNDFVFWVKNENNKNEKPETD